LLPKRPLHNTLTTNEENLSDSSNDDNNGLAVLIKTLASTPSTLNDLVKSLSADASLKSVSVSHSQVQQWLLSGTQQGLIRYEMATQLYHYRPLTQTPLEMAQFAYHNEAEKQAFDLISRTDAVQKLTVETVAVKGITIRADIHVEEDRRTYHSQLQLGDEGLVTKAECSCPQYLQHRLTHGVCAHLIALRLRYNQYDPNNTSNDSWHDTRVLSKRVPSKRLNKTKGNQASAQVTANSGSLVALPSEVALDLTALAQPAAHTHKNADGKAQDLSAQETSIAYVYLTIAHKKITVEQTIGDKDTRQQLMFNQPAQAKAAFLQHIARFEAKGFIQNQGM